MADFSYIHIALRGEVQGATRTIYSYPSEGSDIDPKWDTSMVEPGAAIKRFLNANDCYILQASPLGHYFSLITRNTLNPERGYMMISVLLADGCALTGRQLMNIFNNLKKTFLEDENYTNEGVDAALMEAGVPVEPVKLDSWLYQAPAEDEKPAEAGYRTYISVQELESIFSFPSQPEYSRYRCIIVVSATTSLRPGVKMPRITTPIKKLYAVVCPEGASTSAAQVYDGDRLTITYSKEGFNTHTENVIIGTPSAYTKDNGSSILIRSAAQTGIRFIRRVNIKVVSAKGTPLNGYTISVNGRSINTMEPYIDFTEKDLTPGEEVEIQVASNNYRPLKLKKPTEEMLTTENLELQLQPVEQGVTLRLDFGDGRVFEQQISIEKNTPEYNRLHSGNFHGFRAHRQVTQDNSEVYNVDVRITSRPVAPNFESAKAEAPAEPAHRAPKFENISDEAAEERKPIDKTVPVVERKPQSESPTQHNAPAYSRPDFDTDDEDDDNESETGSQSKRGKWLWWAATLVLIAAICTVFVLKSGSDTEEAAPVAEAVTGNEEPAAVQSAPLTVEETSDIDYLNSNPVWDEKKLQSPMGKALIEAINTGDIDAVVNNDYFAVKGRCTNAQANQIADMIWRAKGSYNEKNNSRKLRAAMKDGSINLRNLTDNLAKSQPAERANETPRPSK